MTRNDPRQTDRGQAYTLEGFVSAVIVLTAVLFALQSMVITPTTGGAVDRTVQAQLQQEAQDTLVVAENEGDLSSLVRYWNATDEAYHNVSSIQSINYTSSDFSNTTTMGEEFGFGTTLEERFEESGRSYNVELVYRDDGGANQSSFNLVYQGQPSPNAFSSSYLVTLYDDQRLTAPGSENRTLEQAGDDDGYPIPDIDEDGDGNLYNVVEVRVIVW